MYGCRLRYRYILRQTDLKMTSMYGKQKTSPAGFEPARPKDNALAGHRVNHSAKVTAPIFVLLIILSIAKTSDQGCKVTIFLSLILSVSLGTIST